MEIDSRAITLIQSLRGSQAVLALAFLIVKMAMTVEDLRKVTGLNKDTIYDALQAMSGKGMIFMQRGEHGRQTWLPAGGTFFGLAFDQNRKTSDSGSSSSIVISNSLPIEEEQEESPESENFRFCLAACDEVGIRKPKREKIARLEHVTPEFIREHVKTAKAQGFPIGTAIFRIENNWELEDFSAVEAVSVEWNFSVEDTGPLKFKPETLAELRGSGRRIESGVCSVCGEPGPIVSTRENDYCIDHYNDWRRKTLGFDENGLRK